MAGRAPYLQVRRWSGLVALLGIEVVAFAVHFDPWLSPGRVAALEAGAGAALVALLLARDALPAVLTRAGGAAQLRDQAWRGWLLVHLMGAGLVFALTTTIAGRAAQAGRTWLGAWAACLLLTLGAWLAAAVGPRTCGQWARRAWPAGLAGLGAGIVWLVLRTHGHVWIHAWHQDQLLTALAGALRLLGHEVVLDLATARIGTREFSAIAGSRCMGYEGVMLVSLVTAAVLWVDRHALRLPRALLLIPLAAAVSYLLNAVRIVALIEIGIRWPEVALGGFHSVAGWYSVAAVSLGVVVASQRLRRGGADAPRAPGVRARNPAAFYLTPLLAIIATAMLAHVVASGFDALYPLRIAAAALPLWIYRGRLRGLGWRGSAWAVPVGAGTFVVWLALEPAPTAASPIVDGLAALPAGAAGAWVALRALGSIVTVPVAEELAFRGYVQRKLAAADFERVPLDRFTWLSFLGSSVLFGAMHGRWLAGTLAGMIFAATLYRRGQLADPIVAHATANALIALTVVLTGRWSLWQ